MRSPSRTTQRLEIALNRFRCRSWPADIHTQSADSQWVVHPVVDLDHGPILLIFVYRHEAVLARRTEPFYDEFRRRSIWSRRVVTNRVVRSPTTRRGTTLGWLYKSFPFMKQQNAFDPFRSQDIDYSDENLDPARVIDSDVPLSFRFPHENHEDGTALTNFAVLLFHRRGIADRRKDNPWVDVSFKQFGSLQ